MSLLKIQNLPVNLIKKEKQDDAVLTGSLIDI